MSHPEDQCDKCGGANPSWHAPNPLWNEVVEDGYDILCPSCFQKEAEAKGVMVHFVTERCQTDQAFIVDRVDELLISRGWDYEERKRVTSMLRNNKRAGE